MSMTNLLPRFTLLNTRPEHQAEGLTNLVKQAGGEGLNCPTLEIQWSSQEVLSASLTKDLEQYDKVILTSVNAVNAVKEFLKSHLQRHVTSKPLTPFLKTQFFAIGKATQQAALNAQLPVEPLAEGAYDSEALLEQPAMQSVKGKSILIIKGQAGRSLLMSELTERGALVDCWDVYSRVSAKFCSETWHTFIKAPRPILLITSVASFESLMANLLTFDTDYQWDLNGKQQRHQAWSFLRQTVVFSQRIKDFMLRQGWSGDIQVVCQQSDLGVIQAIERCL